MRYLADRSYAVYLLHGEALAIVRKLPDVGFFWQLVFTWLLTLLFAEILYRVVERPFMDLRERLRAVRSQSHAKEHSDLVCPNQLSDRGEGLQLAGVPGNRA
jgi:peptidoglycan/LPS O-acetylase OafA/YrhL